MRDFPYEIELTRRNGDKRLVVFRKSRVEDLPEIMALQDETHQNIPDKKLFNKTTEEELRDSIENDLCCSVFHDGTMVGFTLLVRPRISYRNFGKYLEYDDEKLLKCVSLDTSFIMQEYRGFGLQDVFFKLRIEEGIALGAEEALSTISPDNEVSLKNAYANGFEVASKLEIYDGLERYILKRDLTL